MNKEYKIKLDLNKKLYNKKMAFNQFDENVNDFYIEVTKNNELVKDLDKSIITLVAIKPNSEVDAQFIEVKEGQIYADLKPSMCDLVGNYQAKAMIVLEGEIVTTDTINYSVNEDKIISRLNDDIVSDERFTLFTDALARLSTIEISEEQRVINEAERILAEENRKIEEAKRVEAELIRQHEEADRTKYDAIRESNENIRKQNESIRLANETNRIDEEAKRVDEEAKRKLAEEERNANYNFMTEDEERRRLEANAHKEAENLRVQAETNRVNGEAKRRTTEQARVSAENTRVGNENTRKANEETRQSNETQRVEAETQRQNRYNSFISDAEANANNFENYTNTAKVKEEERKSNELDRRTQEAKRVSNEVERISNENTRKANEVTRIESEKQRADAENLRKEKIIEIQSDYDSLKKVIIDENASANLQNQINQTNSQLEQIENNVELNYAKKDDVAKISSGTPLFASSKSGMTDITKNYVNTSDGYLYIYNGEDWTKTSVQYQSTGIAKKSIDKSLVEENLLTSILGEKVLSPQETPYVWGKVVSSIDGTIANNSNAGYFDIPLNGVKKINIPLISIDNRTDRGYAFYDNDGTFIKGGASNSYSTPTMVIIDVPSNAVNIKICYKVLESFNYITMYIDSEYSLYNFEKFKKGEEIINIPIESLTSFEFENNNLFDQFSKENLYDKGLGSNLLEYDLVGSMVTHYISVTPNKNIYIEVPTHKSTGENNIIIGRYVTYDTNKKPVARYDLPTNSNKITIPDGIYYIRLSFYYETYYKNIYSRIIVSETELPYTKYGYQMPLLNVKKENITPSFYNWFNKKWVSIGDSNTSRRQYQKYVIDELGLRWSNHAAGGTDASYWADDTKLQLIVDEMPDIVTIMLGTNTGALDGALPPNNIPITYEWDKTTYVGAMCYIIQYIQTRLPLCRIILMTPPYATDYSNPREYFSTGIYNKINLLENIALRYGCEFLNVYSLASMYNFKSMFPDEGDGVHFGDEYGRRIARKLISKMKEIEPII